VRPFIAFLCRQPDTGFLVSFPDFPDCRSAGRTLAEAQFNAQSALTLHCRRLHNRGAPIPTPSFLHDIEPRDDRPDGLVLLIAAPDSESKIASD
jgi:predicted RNase H-like HicB family nuclease